MEFRVCDGARYQKIIEAEVSAEEMKPVYEKIRIRLIRKSKMAGHRSNTPFEPEQSDILKELANDFLPDLYEKGLHKTGLEAVAKPTVEITHPSLYDPLVCRFTVTVKPKINLGQYMGLKTRRVLYTVTDLEVEAEWLKQQVGSEPEQAFVTSKETIRADLVRKKQELADREARSNVLMDVITRTEIDVPPIMIEQETDRMMEETQQYLSLLGQSMEQYLEYTGNTMELMRKNDRERAEMMVRRELVLEEIVRREAIEATQEDIEAAISELAKQYKMQPDKVRKTVLKNYSRSELTHRTQMGKALDLICGSAVIVDETPPHDKGSTLN